MLKMKSGGVCVMLMVALACVAGAGCAVTAEPEGEDVGTVAEAVRAERGALPVDSTSQASSDEKPTRLIKAAKFTKTPPDRVEILEGTYRTVGSRRFLLDAIKQSEGEYRATLVQTYRGVLPKLPIADAQAAETELVAVVAALDAKGGQK